MSETANKKWLTEDDGTKIVPRTLISCVQDEDGNTLQESVDNMLVIEPEETTEIPDDITSVVTSQDIYNIVSDVYDNTKTYSVGDYCIKDNMLYKCNTEITEAEEFDSSKWDATTCGSEFDSLNSKLANQQVTNAPDTRLQTQTYPINEDTNVFWVSASYGYNTFPIGMAFRNGSDDLKQRALKTTVVNTDVIVTFDFDNNTVTTDRGTGSVANDLYIWIVPISL